MKKIVFCILMSMTLLMSCDITDKYGKCQINYSIIYPDTTITYDSIFKYRWVTENDYTHTPYTSSYRGSNYILLGCREYCHTTCPIRINSYKTITKRIEDE